MSNSLLRTVERMRRELVRPRARQTFVDAQARHEVLAGHADLPALIHHLQTPGDPAKQECILRALIAEYRVADSPLWSTALVSAFYPMLVRLRARLRDDAYDGYELDQIVVAAFIETVAELAVKLPDKLAARLRTYTTRRVMATLQAETRERHGKSRLADEPRDPDDDPFPGPNAPEVDGDDIAEEAAAHIRWAERTLGPKRMELIRARHLDRVPFAAVVGRRYPDATDEERPLYYQRVKRAKSRAMQHLVASIPRHLDGPAETTLVEWAGHRWQATHAGQEPPWAEARVCDAA